MERPLQITFHEIEPSEALEEHIRQKAAKLERFYEHVIGVRVTIEAPHRRSHKGQLYEVRLDVRVPDDEIVVNRSHGRDPAHEDVYVAVRDAFNAATRQLEDYARRRRGD